MKFEFDNSPRPFNFKRASLFLLALSLLFLVFRMYLSFKDYKNNHPHEVEVSYYNHKIKKVEKGIANGKLYTTAKTTYIIESKSYAQYFILEFKPSSRNFLSLFFCINFFIVASILAVAARKSSVDKIFTQELLKGLNFLIAYIIVMMVSKFVINFYVQNYIEKISNNEVSYYLPFSGDSYVYQISMTLIILFINFVKKGVELQQEKDLTI